MWVWFIQICLLYISWAAFHLVKAVLWELELWWVSITHDLSQHKNRFRILHTLQGSYPPLSQKVYLRSCLGTSESNSHKYTLIAQGVHDFSDTKKMSFLTSSLATFCGSDSILQFTAGTNKCEVIGFLPRLPSSIHCWNEQVWSDRFCAVAPFFNSLLERMIIL